MFAQSTLDLCDGESCVKSIALAELVECSVAADKPLVVNLMYTSVPEMLVLSEDGAALSPRPGAGAAEVDKIVMSGALTCLSAADANDIAFLLQVIVGGSFARFEQAQICLHKR